MIDDCEHNNKRAVIDCLELEISLVCDNCEETVKSRPLTEDEIDRIIKKELGRYGS